MTTLKQRIDKAPDYITASEAFLRQAFSYLKCPDKPNLRDKAFEWLETIKTNTRRDGALFGLSLAIEMLRSEEAFIRSHSKEIDSGPAWNWADWLQAKLKEE